MKTSRELAGKIGQPHADLANARYHTDFAVWVAEQAAALRLRDVESLDTEHIIEELQALAGRDRSELRSRLTTMMEHLIMLHEGLDAQATRGWQNTITRSARAIKELLFTSPSLKTYLTGELYMKAFLDARDDVAKEYEAAPIPDDRLDHYITFVEDELRRVR